MPTYSHLRLVKPAGDPGTGTPLIEVETTNRLALRMALGADSLPPPSELSEVEAGSLMSAGPAEARRRFYSFYCVVPAGEDPVAWRAARPWCAGAPSPTPPPLATPNRDALQARLRVTALPDIGVLPESLAATITDEEFRLRFCRRYSTSPWCFPAPAPTPTPTPTPPPTPTPTPTPTPSSTPYRDALQARLHVPSLPNISVLPESLAATITNEQFRAQFCPMFTSEEQRVAYERDYPWCGSPPPIPSVGPLVPGYATGRPAPSQHYATWDDARYILGDERAFLLALPPDDYYRVVDKMATGGPISFHAAVRAEAARRGVADPLAAVVGLDITISNEQTDWLSRAFVPVFIPVPVLPPTIPPLIPGYAAGRIAPVEHYPTWFGVRYVIGDEKSFLLSLPADEYYRLIDKMAQGGPVAFHNAVRVEATRRGVVDPLMVVVGLDAVVSAQQADWLGRTVVIQPSPATSPAPAPAPSDNGWQPIAVVAALGLAAWWLWPTTKPARSAS